MIKKTAVLLVLGLLISMNPGAVFAVESVDPVVTASPTVTNYPTINTPTDNVVKTDTGDLVIQEPAENFRFVGLQVAWINVSETITKLLARTEEQKAEVELRYAEKTEKLKEKIASSEDPSKFEALLKKMEAKQKDRLEKIDLRIEKLGDKKDAFKQKLERWEIRKKENQQFIQRTKDTIKSRQDGVKAPIDTGVKPSVTVTIKPTDNPEMRGGNIRIDKPTTNRVDVR